jgi:hypothetical protein
MSEKPAAQALAAQHAIRLRAAASRQPPGARNMVGRNPAPVVVNIPLFIGLI